MIFPTQLDKNTNKFTSRDSTASISGDSFSLVEIVLGSRRVKRLRACGVELLFLRCGECGKVHAVTYHCTERVCRLCAITIRARLATLWGDILTKYWLPQVDSLYRFRLVTLTLAPVGDVRERVAEIHRCFNLLWRRTWGKDRRAGAIACIEIASQVHIHVLVFGRYLSKFKLSALWSEITGTSCIVDIREVRRLSGAVREVIKYIGKGICDESDPVRVALLAYAFQGKRRVVTKGCFYNVKWKLQIRAYCVGCGGDGLRLCSPREIDESMLAKPIFHVKVVYLVNPYDSS